MSDSGRGSMCVAVGLLLMFLGGGALLADYWPDAMRPSGWVALGSLSAQVPLWSLFVCVLKHREVKDPRDG